jgi:hypothetical protein
VAIICIALALRCLAGGKIEHLLASGLRWCCAELNYGDARPFDWQGNNSSSSPQRALSMAGWSSDLQHHQACTPSLDRSPTVCSCSCSREVVSGPLPPNVTLLSGDVEILRVLVPWRTRWGAMKRLRCWDWAGWQAWVRKWRIRGWKMRLE